jgi:hypothetical protein
MTRMDRPCRAGQPDGAIHDDPCDKRIARRSRARHPCGRDHGHGPNALARILPTVTLERRGLVGQRRASSPYGLSGLGKSACPVSHVELDGDAARTRIRSPVEGAERFLGRLRRGRWPAAQSSENRDGQGKGPGYGAGSRAGGEVPGIEGPLALRCSSVGGRSGSDAAAGLIGGLVQGTMDSGEQPAHRPAPEHER